MMKKIYVNGVHEYDYASKPYQTSDEDFAYANEVRHELYYSNHHDWSEDSRGKLAMTLADYGDGVRLPEGKHWLDYSEAQQIRILLGIIMKEDCEELQIRIDI
jgi:hypothetical protein